MTATDTESWDSAPRTRPAESLACQADPACTYYAAGKDPRNGRRMCGRHLPDMPVTCPICEGSGERPVLPVPLDPSALETRECWACDGNGALTPAGYTALTAHLTENA